MKKIAVLMALLCVISASAFAQGSASFAKDGVLIEPGSLNANAGLAFGYGWGFGIGGGAEFPIGKFTIAEKLPFVYGAAARVGVYLGTSINVSVGAMGTLHFCWGALGLPDNMSWINNIDSYIGLGLQAIPTFGFNSIAGTSYFLSKNLAINVESGLSSTYLGVLMKF